jgi:hypothetical protein
MPNYDFNKDLPIARKTERQIANYLVEKGMTFVSECNNSDYDLLMKRPDGSNFTVEIKEDFTCERTGNVGVESESWGRLSGISVSKADYYLYKVHEPNGQKNMYLIRTSKLKKMIERNLWFREVVGGDPGSNSRNYLFKLNVVKDNFAFIGTLPE